QVAEAPSAAPRIKTKFMPVAAAGPEIAIALFACAVPELLTLEIIAPDKFPAVGLHATWQSTGLFWTATTGEVKVLLVSVSVVALPTIVSAVFGKVNVTAPDEAGKFKVVRLLLAPITSWFVVAANARLVPVAAPILGVVKAKDEANCVPVMVPLVMSAATISELVTVCVLPAKC